MSITFAEFEERFTVLNNKLKEAVFPKEPSRPSLDNLLEVKEWVVLQEQFLEDMRLAKQSQILFDESNLLIEEEIDNLIDAFTGIHSYNISLKTKQAINNKAWYDKRTSNRIDVICYIKELLEDLFSEYKIN